MSNYGGANAPRYTRLGVITNRSEIVRRTSEQTACNYYEITVPAYTTTVLYLDTRGELMWRYEGTCTDEHFVNRVFQHSSLAEKRYVGKPMTDWHHAYGYELLRLMLCGDWTILLDEGCEVTVEVTHPTHEVTEGMRKHTSSSVMARIVPPSAIYSEV